MNIAAVLDAQARRLTEKPCVHYRGETWSYRDLNARVCAASASFRARGVKPGDVIAHTFGCERALLVSMLATARLGATVLSVPANTPPARRDAMFARLGPVWLATDLPELEYQNLQTLRVATDATSADTAPIEPEPAAPWVLATGSGSTGQAKFMPVSHQQQLIRMRMGDEWLPYGGNEVFASAVHLDFYAAKQRYLEAIAQGATLYLAGEGRIHFGADSGQIGVTSLYATVFHIEGLLRNRPPARGRSAGCGH